VFGILRPCQHRLSPALRTEWVAHLCGLCLTLRDQHGQLARAATNYDGIVVSALVEAQSDTESSRRVAGPCPLRGMRRASVAEGAGSSLAASVSLVLASAKVRDHADDGDGVLRHRSLATLARSAAGRWADRGGRTAALVRFDASVLTTAVESQAAVESALGPGDSVLAATEPTELATAAAFAHTAVLAGRPENAEPLHEVGRFFGRVAHLLDAVEDLDADRAAGVWNPLTATNTSLATARRLCDDAVRGVRWALRDVTLTRPALVHALLVHELRHAVRRTFGHASGRDGHGGHGGPGDHGDHLPYDASGSVPPPPPFVGTDGDKGSVPPPAGPDGPTPPPHDHVFVNDGDGGCCWVPKFRVPPRRRNVVLGCGVATYMCCTCQFCCRDPWPGPWSGRPHDALVDCCDGCDCCNCCD
jgi:hypothetical protein